MLIQNYTIPVIILSFCGVLFCAIIKSFKYDTFENPITERKRLEKEKEEALILESARIRNDIPSVNVATMMLVDPVADTPLTQAPAVHTNGIQTLDPIPSKKYAPLYFSRYAHSHMYIVVEGVKQSDKDKFIETYTRFCLVNGLGRSEIGQVIHLPKQFKEMPENTPGRDRKGSKERQRLIKDYLKWFTANTTESKPGVIRTIMDGSILGVIVSKEIRSKFYADRVNRAISKPHIVFVNIGKRDTKHEKKQVLYSKFSRIKYRYSTGAFININIDECLQEQCEMLENVIKKIKAYRDTNKLTAT